MNRTRKVNAINKANRRAFLISLHKIKDKDVIDELLSHTSTAAYIKRLVREDIANGHKN